MHERKHKGIKRFANEVRNTSVDWDRSVLREATAHHMGLLQQKSGTDLSEVAGLVEGRKAGRRVGPSLEDAFGISRDYMTTSRRARVNEWETVSVGDVVLAGATDPPTLGELQLHAAVELDGETEPPFSFLRRFSVQESPRSWKCKLSEVCTVVETSDIVCALIWGGNPPGRNDRPEALAYDALCGPLMIAVAAATFVLASSVLTVPFRTIAVYRFMAMLVEHR